MVDVVTASKETIFFNWRAELKTSVLPMKTDPKEPTPDTFRSSSSVWPSTSKSPFASIFPVNVDTPVIWRSPPTFKFLNIPTPPDIFTAPVVELVESVKLEKDEIPDIIKLAPSISSVKTNFSVVVSYPSIKPSSFFLSELTSLKLFNLVGGADALDNTLITFCEPILSFMVVITLLLQI